MPPTTTIVPRAQPTEAVSHSSSVFTFLIALLILLCTSAAVVLRAVLMRRRFRRRVQDALDAGILFPSRPLPGNKPKMWEIWVRACDNDVHHDWDAYKPLSATKVPDNITVREKRPPKHTISLRPPAAGRLMEMLGHPPTISSINLQPADPPTDSKFSAVQVAILISMPSPQPTIPVHEQISPPSSLKGKEKDPDAHDDPDANTDVFPDVMFGISTFASHDT